MSLPDVEWNQLVLVCKQGAEVSVWVGWKRAVAGFVDPRLWQGPDHWGEYFERQPDGTGWGMAGYGLVVLDVDTQTAWSINDYSTPGSLRLPARHESEGTDESGSRRAFLALLAQPAEWPHARFLLARAPRDGWARAGEPQRETRTLADLASADRSPAENLERLATHFGELELGKERFIELSGDYVPAGWTVHSTRGRSDLDVLTQLLEHAQATGFPPPEAELIVPFAREQAEMDEDEDETAATADRLTDLLARWAAPAPAIRLKNPGVS